MSAGIPLRRVWSQEQQAIFASFANETENLVVEALAGTGKTTTITEAFRHAPQERILYAVFNKKNQLEAQGKIKDSRVDVKTLHSLGFAFIKRVWSNARPDNDVEFDRVCKALDGRVSRDQKHIFAAVAKLVGFVKNLFVAPTTDDIHETMEARDCQGNSDYEDGVIVAAVFEVLRLSKERDAQGRSSFDDMVWLPCAMNWVRKWYDLVVIDEAQDMNMPQLMMAVGASKGRVVVVGDSRQAIYYFRGAVMNGMTMMRERLSAKVLTLSTTYRCPKSVVEKAKEFVPLYIAHESNGEGVITSTSKDKVLELAKPGDVILSRLNAPLMPLALSFLRKRIPAKIEGRDLAKQILSMIGSFKAKSVPDYISKVNSWADKQIQRAIDGCKDEDKADKKCEVIRDLAETLIAIAEGVRNVDEIKVRVDELFQDTKDGMRPCVILSSVHKAKGLEWDRVFILSETFRVNKGQEEQNIYYVAITRTKRELYLVGGPAAVPQDLPKTSAPASGNGSLVAEQAAEVAKVTTVATETAPAVPTKLSSYDIAPGHVFHRRGNVIQHGGSEYVCERVSDCNAQFRCLTKMSVTREFTDGNGDKVEKTFTAKVNKVTWLCNSYNPLDQVVIRTMTEEELTAFLTNGKARPTAQEQTTKQQGQEQNVMAKATKTERPSLAGSGDYIRKLKADGTNKADAYEKASKKYGFGKPRDGKVPAWFDKVFNSKPKVAKPAKAAKATKSAKTPPARKAAAKAPAAPKAGPPPRSTPPPPAASQPAEAAQAPEEVASGTAVPA